MKLFSATASMASLLCAALGFAWPTGPVVPGQDAAEPATEGRTLLSTKSHRSEEGATTISSSDDNENGFLSLVQGWQYRRASGYYILTDACGGVITEFQEARHVKLSGCNVTECTEDLLDYDTDETTTTTEKSSSTWCNGPVTRSTDPVTNLMGHLRCLASLSQIPYYETPGGCLTCRQVVMEKRIPYRGQTGGRCYGGQPMKKSPRKRPSQDKASEKGATEMSGGTEAEPEVSLELRR